MVRVATNLLLNWDSDLASLDHPRHLASLGCFDILLMGPDGCTDPTLPQLPGTPCAHNHHSHSTPTSHGALESLSRCSHHSFCFFPAGCRCSGLVFLEVTPIVPSPPARPGRTHGRSVRNEAAFICHLPPALSWVPFFTLRPSQA